MFPIGDAAAPDDADFQFAHLFFLLQINFHVNPFTGKGLNDSSMLLKIAEECNNLF